MRCNRLSAVVCAALLPLSAFATPFTYEISGVINSAYWDEHTPVELTPLLTSGTTFTGTFTYESETPATFESDTVKIYNGAITAATFSFGPGGSLGIFGFDGTHNPGFSSPSDILVLNDLEFDGNPPFDQFNLSSSLGRLPTDPANVFRSWGFGAFGFDTVTVPAGWSLLDPLPIDSLLTGFPSFSFGYSQYDADGQLLFSTGVGSDDVTLRQVQRSVPEPGTWSLLTVGLAGMWLATRRRTARAVLPN